MPTTWSTHHVAPSQRAEYWRAAVCEAFLAMTPRLPDCDDFRAQLTHTGIERLSFNRVHAPAHGVLRTPLDLARAGPDYLFVNLHRSGRGRVRQFGRDQLGQPGELMFIDSSAPYRIDLPDGGELLSLALPRADIERRVGGLGQRIAQPLPMTPAARLLRAQMATLAGAALAPEPAAPACGRLADRLRALIVRHVGDPDFGPSQAARMAGVALRSVHASLAAEGTTFKALQTEYRLQRARQMLAGGGASTRVSDVALHVGFRSPEHFSRRFRARFGVTADGWRRG